MNTTLLETSLAMMIPRFRTLNPQGVSKAWRDDFYRFGASISRNTSHFPTREDLIRHRILRDKQKVIVIRSTYQNEKHVFTLDFES